MALQNSSKPSSMLDSVMGNRATPDPAQTEADAIPLPEANKVVANTEARQRALGMNDEQASKMVLTPPTQSNVRTNAPRTDQDKNTIV